MTFTEGIMKECKLQEKPGPGAYQHNDSFKRKKPDKEANSVARTDKVCAFIEEARFVGMQTPAPKYAVDYVRSLLLPFTYLDRIRYSQTPDTCTSTRARSAAWIRSRKTLPSPPLATTIS